MATAHPQADQMKKLRLSGVVKQSIVDGPGLRFTVFTQGCPHRCPGCHNPQTHDFEDGYVAGVDALLTEFDRNPLLKGMTFTGGEPFCQAEALAPLAEAVHARGKDIICYSGYTFEELVVLAEEEEGVKRLLSLTDILIDGRFVLEQRDLTLRFRGSVNQRILSVPESLRTGIPEEIEL